MGNNRYQNFGPQLVEAGYDITPVDGKRAFLTGWSGRPPEALLFGDYPNFNIGVLCGGVQNVVAIDVDVVNHFCINSILELIEETLGFGPRRIGKPPKFLMVFRCTEPMVKQKTGIYEIDGVDCAVELLAEGQQFVASGIHPDTHRPYEWPGDKLIDVPAAELTEVTPEAFKQFLNAASRILSNYGALKGRVSERSAPPKSGLMLTELEGKIEEVRAALTYIPNDDEHYDDWVHTIHAIKGALGEDGRDLAHEWSGLSGKYEAGETDRLWDSIKSVDHIGAGSLFHWASEYGFDLREEQIGRAHV